MVDLLNLRCRKRDGGLIRQAQCPDCGIWGELDDDQYHGRVSMLCECGYHETHKFQTSVNKGKTKLVRNLTE